jgi:hypothetical protein
MDSKEIKKGVTAATQTGKNTVRMDFAMIARENFTLLRGDTGAPAPEQKRNSQKERCGKS